MKSASISGQHIFFNTVTSVHPPFVDVKSTSCRRAISPLILRCDPLQTAECTADGAGCPDWCHSARFKWNTEQQSLKSPCLTGKSGVCPFCWVESGDSPDGYWVAAFEISAVWASRARRCSADYYVQQNIRIIENRRIFCGVFCQMFNSSSLVKLIVFDKQKH